MDEAGESVEQARSFTKLMPPANESLAYNLRGGMISDGLLNFSWDNEDRLTSVTSALSARFGAENVEWASGAGRTIQWPSQLPLPQAGERLFRVNPSVRSGSFVADLTRAAGPRPPGAIAHHVQPLQLGGSDNGVLNGTWILESAHQTGHGALTPIINSLPYGTEFIIMR